MGDTATGLGVAEGGVEDVDWEEEEAEGAAAGAFTLVEEPSRLLDLPDELELHE